MTFAAALRAILRQAPNIIMIGEIRDLETASIAINASLTGHLVLSTLHTNTAVGAITRLQDMGVEPFLLSSSVIAVLAQRLVRVLCDGCKEGHAASEGELAILGMAVSTDEVTIYRATGCDLCNHAGYKGRTGIYEMIEIDDQLRTMIHEGASEQEMLTEARKRAGGILDDGRRRILAGETTIEEVLRVTAA
jgi:general secretion pathway protein E